MRVMLGMMMPISVFILQGIYIVFSENLEDVGFYYGSFIASYIASFVIFYCISKIKPIDKPRKFLYKFFNIFFILKIFTIIYFILIFINYINLNGYDAIRDYLNSEAVKYNIFYFAPFMYLEAYILYPLTVIALIFFVQTNQLYKFTFIILIIIGQNFIIYASRMPLYYFFMIYLFYQIYNNILSFKKINFIIIAVIFSITLSNALYLLRDNSNKGDANLSTNLIAAVLNYHIVQPVLLSSIIKDSILFNNSAGYGLATFGFLTDPIVGLLVGDGAKKYMPSKLLNAEAQDLKLKFDDSDKQYNAFTTFLLPAIYDFGIIGPTIYGFFFGGILGWSLKGSNFSRQLIFIVFSYYVFFNAFTFFITGDWFLVIMIGLFFYTNRTQKNSRKETNA